MPRKYTATASVHFVTTDVYEITKYRHNEPLLLFSVATRDTFRRAALSESTVLGLITAHPRADRRLAR